MWVQKGQPALWVFRGPGDRSENASVLRSLSQCLLHGEGQPGLERCSVNTYREQEERKGRECKHHFLFIHTLPGYWSCLWFSNLVVRCLRINGCFKTNYRKCKCFLNKRHLLMHPPSTQREAGVTSLPMLNKVRNTLLTFSDCIMGASTSTYHRY